LRRIASSSRVLTALIVTLGLAACEGGATVGSSGPPPRGTSVTPTPLFSLAPGSTPTPVPTLAPGSSPTPSPGPTTFTTNPIKHIVIIIQENRPFDDLFHGFTEASGAVANYATACPDKEGNMHALEEVPYENLFDPNNYHADFEADYDGGKNDGFYDNNASISEADTANNGCAYLPQTEVQPYWDMATEGSLAENAFHGVTGPTYPSHLMFVAASSTYDGNPMHRVIDSPTQASLGWGCEDPNPTEMVGTLNAQGQEVPGPFPCYSIPTLADLLQMNNNTWHFYSGPVQAPNSPITAGGQTVTTPGGNLEALASYRQIYYGSTWSTNAIQPEERVLTDVAAGTLEDVTWVTPDGVNTDHPGASTAAGPQWVGAVVNAIGESQFYSSTAIFVTWDDWGGFYDHVPPPQKYAPYGLGFRIPIICISPYAKHGQLIETQLEPASIILFAEETFGLPSLGREDATANSASAMLDFTQSPAPYKVVSVKLGPKHFLAEKPSYLPVDRDELGPAGGHYRIRPGEPKGDPIDAEDR
jgi:phospholipase C